MKPWQTRPAFDPSEKSKYLTGLPLTSLDRIYGDHPNVGQASQCPYCGTEWDDVLKTTLLGCPVCYQAFEERLKEKFSEVFQSVSQLKW